MKARKIVPEILDELPADDPDAIRSRRDLRVVNAMMGNYRWIADQMILHSAGQPEFRWLELGAGDGGLAKQFPADTRLRMTVSAIDLVNRPQDWPDHWDWLQGNLFDVLETENFDGVIANLFLHHFRNDELNLMGSKLAKAKLLLFSEPRRSPLHHWQGRLLDPFVNHVTTHDMHVSIDAGFSEDELSKALKLDTEKWDIQQSETFLGAYRLRADAR